MVSDCCVCKLSQGVIPNISFHSIPKCEERRAKWLEQLQKNVSKRSFVCSRHFLDSDFEYKTFGNSIRRFLKAAAIPTLLLNKHDHIDVTLEDNQIESRSKENDGNLPIIGDDSNDGANQTDFNEVLGAVESMAADVSTDGTFNDAVDCNDDLEETFVNLKTNKNIKKRKNESENDVKKRSKCRYIGDLKREDFSSDEAFYVVKKHQEVCQKRLRMLHQKLNQLEKRFSNLKGAMEHLKERGMLSTEAINALKVRFLIT